MFILPITFNIVKHRVCPQCGSENMDLEIGFIGGMYRCKDCDYVGSVIFEFNDVEYKKFLNELKEDHESSGHIDTK